jgi:hypothetical protein
MSLFRTKKTKVMLIIFGLFIQQPTNTVGNYLKIQQCSAREFATVPPIAAIPKYLHENYVQIID